MGKIKARLKMPFGEIILEGENPQEIVRLLQEIPEDFIEIVSSLAALKLTSTPSMHLHGLVEMTTEGPVIVTGEKLTHYEAIGIVLYASEGKENTSATISRLLESSGIRSMVPARLNEMTKRGHVFKPNPNRAEYRLTVQGERWIEDEVLSRLKGKIG